jgi:hypothetical protein
MEHIARMEGRHGVVAGRQIAKVIHVLRSVMRELFLDQADRLLVVIREQAHKGIFLRMHALACN